MNFAALLGGAGFIVGLALLSVEIEESAPDTAPVRLSFETGTYAALPCIGLIRGEPAPPYDRDSSVEVPLWLAEEGGKADPSCPADTYRNSRMALFYIFGTRSRWATDGEWRW